MTDLSRCIRQLAHWILAGFICLCLLLTYWQIVMARTLNASPYNPRDEERLRRCIPGRILSADGVTILGRQRTREGWDVILRYPMYEDRERDIARLYINMWEGTFEEYMEFLGVKGELKVGSEFKITEYTATFSILLEDPFHR